jgi:hypothetical protein
LTWRSRGKEAPANHAAGSENPLLRLRIVPHKALCRRGVPQRLGYRRGSRSVAEAHELKSAKLAHSSQAFLKTV